MSVWVFKDSDKELIPAELLESQLAAGWSVTDPAVVELTESNDTGSSAIFDEMSVKEVREKAKEAGIEDHDKARIKTLKEKLGAS